MDVKDPLFRLMCPAGMLDYFEIVKVTQLYAEGGVEIELEENPAVPGDFPDRDNYISHGFHDWQIIHDHPLCGCIFNLEVHRRRWKHEVSGEVRSRDWTLVAKGSSLSQEFADFLKASH